MQKGTDVVGSNPTIPTKDANSKLKVKRIDCNSMV